MADFVNILDLGALKEAQTFIMAERPGVKKVLALEGREQNLRKARLIQDLVHVRNEAFAQANLEKSDLSAFGKLDAVFSGLLYHLSEPWTLIEKLSAIAPNLLIWTHYAPDAEAEVISNGLRGRIFRGEGLRRTAPRHVGHGHMADAGIADYLADQE